MSTPRKYGTPHKSATPGRLPPRFTPRKSPKRSPRKTPAKNVENEQGEEGITVAIRMRPLNAKEENANRVWRVLPQYNSVAQTTSAGQPLPERVNGRTFFTFDKTFGEDANNVGVYENVAKGIVESVASGLNGTIFAYGQTSSGKTYTMQGSGSIEEGYSNGGGGVVHMAANDIFAHVTSTPDRIFLIRASFIEIYNEEVRDLLGDNAVLAVREDPRRGVFVSAVEEIVTDFESLLRVLFSGEKNRAVAATGMNERSSRSHTIFRITIESRQKGEESNENDMSASNSSLSSDDGAVRISTLNLVDLAGSESVRHTGSTGERQKEGGKINQSLLTLSRVIVGLGQPNQTHINFRDSKLTRILQPSLSGNARMAVICCATPSEFYLEETRSTLLFASRAKLVKTRAQVNEVLDDRSLIKRLQRELAEARRQSAGPGQIQHLKALETEALNAGTAARDAEKKLDKLKSSILNHAAVFGDSTSNRARLPGIDAEILNSGVLSASTTRKRRLSDGVIAIIDSTALTTPSRATSQRASSPSSVPHENKKLKRVELKGPLSPSSELQIVRQAYNAKVEQAKELEQRLGELEGKLCGAQASLTDASQTISELESSKDEAIEETQQLTSEISSLFTEMQAAALRHENAITANDATMNALTKMLETEQSSKAALEESMNELTKENGRLKEVIRASEEQAVDEATKAAEEKSRLEGSIQTLLDDKASLVEKCEQMESAQVESKQKISEFVNEKKELQGRIDSLSEERVKSAFEVAKVNSEKEQLAQEKESHRNKIQEMSSELTLLKATMGDMVEEKGVLANKLSAANDSLRELNEEKEGLVENVAELTDTIKRQDNTIESLQDRIQDMETIASALVDEMSLKESELAEKTSQVQSLSSELETQAETISNLKKSVQDFRQKYDNDTESLVAEKQALEQKVEQLKEETNALTSEATEASSQISHLTSCLEEKTALVETLIKTVEETESSLKDTETVSSNMSTQLAETKTLYETATEEIEGLKTELATANSTNAALEAEVDELKSVRETNDQKIQELSTGLHQASTRSEFEQEEKERLASLLDECTSERDDARSRFDSISRDLAVAEEVIETSRKTLAELETERDQLNSKLEATTADKGIAETQNTNLEASKAEVETRLANAHVQLDTLRAENRALADDVAARQASETLKSEELLDTQVSLEEALEEITTLKASISDMKAQRDVLNAALDAATADKGSVELRVGSLEVSKAEVDARLTEALAQVDTLTAEKQALFDDVTARQVNEEVLKSEELHDAKVSLEKAQEQIEASKALISEMEAHREELNAQLKDTTGDKEAVESQAVALEASKVEVESRLAEALTQVDVLAAEKQDIATRETSETDIRETQSSLEEAREKIQSLQATIKGLESSEKEAKSIKMKLEEVEAEATDLKQLLAAANDSVRGAREAALAAEDELEEKDKTVQESLQCLSKSEENLRIATDKLSQFESQASSDAHEELKKQINVLSNEVAEAETKLESERSERRAAEEDIKRQMAEEQRELIQEAESRMASLKGRVDELTQSLSSAESETYAARQEMEDLQDQNKRLENTALEADMLRQSEKRLKDQVSGLSEDRLALQSELARTKQELESQSKDSDREVVETIAELNRVKSECYAEKQKGIGLSQQVERLVQENSSSTREIRLFREKTATFETSISKLEDENHTLMTRLRELELADSQQMENVVQREEMSSLISRIKELESVVSKKDTRIKKLESVKLTKQKVAEINKLQVERMQFQNDVEQCRQELAAANKTITDLQAKVIRVSREAGSTANDDEMASMKFAKEALETKLRKFAEHCRFLEDEKANIIDALKSVDGCDVHDGDISTAIVALCDRHSSLEEECDALMSAEKRASSYLSELDHLRETNAHLQSTFAETESKLERLAHSEAELTRKLNDAKEKVTSLRSERDSMKAEWGDVADLESEKARQVKYLEQENLRLMLDLKNAKKQVKNTRAQLDAMRMKIDDDTEDLGGIASQALEASRTESKDLESIESNPASPADKENVQENAGGYVTSTSKPQGSESARKRRFTRPTLSSKKRRNTSTPGRTIGLGEAGTVDEDHTGECKQS